MTKAPSTAVRGRPHLVAPRHYLTLQQAADSADVHYSTVYKAVKNGHVKTSTPTEGGDGSTFVLASDFARWNAERLARTPSYLAEGRRAIEVRPALERYASWQRRAKKDGFDKVSEWLGELADRAVAGVKAGKTVARKAA